MKQNDKIKTESKELFSSLAYRDPVTRKNLGNYGKPQFLLSVYSKTRQNNSLTSNCLQEQWT